MADEWTDEGSAGGYQSQVDTGRGFGRGRGRGFASRSDTNGGGYQPSNGYGGSNGDSYNGSGGNSRGGGDSRGGGSCYNCNGEGHMSRDCPEPKKSGGGGGGSCYNCNGEGHMSRDCPEPKKSGGGSCYNCNGEGHMSRDCPEPKKGGGGGGGGGGGSCYNCNGEGHMSRDCPEPKKAGGGGGNCFNCNQSGHMSRECPEPRKGGPRADGGGGADGDPEKPREIYIPPEPTEDEDQMFHAGCSSGINFDKYEKISIKVTGENVPPPISSFDEAGLRNFVLDNVKKSGYTRPTPVQKHALPIIMSGRDIISCAQTGSGKTAAFLLPIVNVLLSDPKELILTSEQCQPHAIIVSPTRELTLQIFNEARKFSHGSTVRAVVAYGGTASYHQAAQVMKGCHILVATPGRLMDFVNRGRISFASCRFFVLDEADRMLDMGFLPEIEKMLNHETMVKVTERQTLMFSATFPEDIQLLAGKFLNNYIFLAVGIVGGACADVEQRFLSVTKFEKRPKLVELLREEGQALERTLVFVEMKRTADFLAAFLSENDFPTTSIHGDRLQREREEALADFKAGRMPVLVATAVAARGLDIKNVAHVVNYDMPKSIDEYVHRIGRTGRVGNRGKASSFYDAESDAGIARDLMKILKQATQDIPDWLESEAANNASGGGSSGGSRGFGGRDVRKFDQESASGGGGGGSGGVEAAEEDW